ncbi:hypothetical protein TGAM01_v207078 [Trichoderma gamsii]|uniref:Uncharacterized protein n=1 Tax=Trichoderma gamsii TaxID=398673 RepID=A0A2P4ZIG4_9HYPO|nr:hypothetical protein TGAM01_v207078 [Trichoderma gamsii]PON24067.1 hypothetical protein TGAM01_v207078 [Trichoderma gamsii]
MVWGSVSQVLVVDKLPPGLKMFITSIHFDIPEGNNQWWPTFAGISSRSNEAERKKHLPFEAGPSINNGRIGEIVLTSLSNFDSGEGPSARIDFIITGETTLNGKPTAVGQKGTITISTPPWGGFWSFYSNPDKIELAYNLVDSSTKNHTVDISRSGHTLDLNWSLDVDKTGTQLVMRVAPKESLAFDVANLLLGGVKYAHEATYGWVFGALGGWPAAVGLVGGEEIRKMIWKD